MTSLDQPFPGVHLLQPKVFQDNRGDFIKTFHAQLFEQLGISFKPVEEFFSTSKRGVLRGMHFQVPPQAHAKLVYCTRGKVLDVLLDLRKSSPTYGFTFSVELSLENHLQLYLPAGIAHGFLALAPDSVMLYKTDTVHSADHDAGIRWDSFGFNWAVNNPTISIRDQAHMPFREFNSPFL